MPTSGDNDFTITADQLINSALEDVGVLEAGETANTNLQNQCILELNKELVRLGGGIKLWNREWVNTGLTMLADVETYEFTGDDIQNIEAINIIEGEVGNEVSYPVYLIDQNTFFKEIGALNTKGRPTHIMMNPGFDGGDWKMRLKLYPIPEVDYKFEALVVRKGEKFVSAADEAAVPVRWYDALQYGLALRIAPKHEFSVSKISYFEGRYAQAVADARKSDFDNRSDVMTGAYNYRK